MTLPATKPNTTTDAKILSLIAKKKTAEKISQAVIF